ncbi:MAG: hypothetical protein AAGB22_06530 [Bacteroidota bacterium]
MPRKNKVVIVLLCAMLALNGCCIFRKGSWAPLPSCKHVEDEEDKSGKKADEEETE